MNSDTMKSIIQIGNKTSGKKNGGVGGGLKKNQHVSSMSKKK